MGMGLAGLLLPFIRCQLSVLVNFSFSYNTLFLSSLGFMAAQYTPSGVWLPLNYLINLLFQYLFVSFSCLLTLM